MIYTKAWKSYQEQLDLLVSRGLLVTDPNLALQHLERIGYYRLSGYWYAFRERSAVACPLDNNLRKPSKVTETRITLDSFIPGASFHDAVALYIFDKKLRMLVMDAMERIEIALRVDISHTLGKLDPFAYLKPELLHEDFSIKLDSTRGVTEHHTWLGKHAQLISRSKEHFIDHNKERYGLPIAIWVACEVWDFGTLSKLFGGMRERDQDAIAQKYGIGNGRVFASWLRSLNHLRNICAHHGRLWNRNISDQPRLPNTRGSAGPKAHLSTSTGGEGHTKQHLGNPPWVKHFESDTHARARCYVLLIIVKHLLATICPNSSWPDRMKAHLDAFPPLDHVGLNLRGMGAPDDWQAIWDGPKKNPSA
jgi:abi family protein|nr:Abi family protein [Lautropia mirabilis]